MILWPSPSSSGGALLRLASTISLIAGSCKHPGGDSMWEPARVLSVCRCEDLASRPKPARLELESDLFGSALARLDDVDGDGVAELVVGSPRRYELPGSVWVLSGKDLTVLAGIAEPRDAPSGFGWAVAGLPDVDGDGVADVAIGAKSGATGWDGAVYLWSVRTGELFARLAPPASPWRAPGFGSALAVDRNEQRCLLAVGGPSHNRTGGAWVYDMSSLQLVLQALPAEAGPSFGTALSFGPVVEGDRQLIVGAPHVGKGGRVYVIAPRTGELLRSVDGETGDEFGTAIEELGDVDGDGSSDVAIGAPGRADGAGCVRIFSVPAWQLLQNRGILPEIDDWHFVWGQATGAAFGFRIAAPGDLDQDGRADMLVSAPNGDVYDRGGFGWVVGLAGGPGEILLFTDWRGEFVETMCDLLDVGRALCTLGDVDGDGLNDFAFGAPDPFEGGGVQVVSAATGTNYGRGLAWSITLAQTLLPSVNDLGGFEAKRARRTKR